MKPLRCPACGYDVSATIRAHIDVCPECGAPVSEELCATKNWRDHGLKVIARYFLLAALVACSAIVLTGVIFIGGRLTGFEALHVIATLVGYAGVTVCVLGLPIASIALVDIVHESPGAGLGITLFFWLLSIGLTGLVMGAAVGFVFWLVLVAIFL